MDIFESFGVLRDTAQLLYSGSAGNLTVDEFKSIAFPLVRNVFPTTIASENILSVQPMTEANIREYKTKSALRNSFRKLNKTRYKTYINI